MRPWNMAPPPPYRAYLATGSTIQLCCPALSSIASGVEGGKGVEKAGDYDPLRLHEDSAVCQQWEYWTGRQEWKSNDPMIQSSFA